MAADVVEPLAALRGSENVDPVSNQAVAAVISMFRALSDLSEACRIGDLSPET